MKNKILIFILTFFLTSTSSLFAFSNQQLSINSLDLRIWISISVLIPSLILILYFFKLQSTFNKELLKKFQEFDSNKMEELRLYVLIIGILAPLSEFFIYIFDIRRVEEIEYNIVYGVVMISLYFLSKNRTKLITFSYFVLISYFFVFYSFTCIKLFLYETEYILFAEFFLCLFFSYYIFFKLVHYYLFILFVLLCNLTLFFSTELSLKNKLILLIFSFIILILNHLRQIIYFKQQERLHFVNNIVNTGLSIVIATNKDKKITFVSENVKEILGYSPKELLGDGWWKKTIDANTDFENKKVKLFNEISNEGVNSRLIKTKSGSYKWIQFQDKKYDDSIYVGIGQDITELKNNEFAKIKREEKLKNQQEILQKIHKIQYNDINEFNEDINQILKIVTEGISLDIVGLLEYTNDNLKVISSYEKSTNSFHSGEIFSLSKYPIYKEALLSGKNIIVSDTRENDLIKEFVNAYIKVKNIKSLADIPIFIGGKMKFILSCENTKEYYDWDDDDINFLKSIAEFLTTLIENKKRKEAEKLVIESENVFRQINETIDNVFFLFDLISFKILYISPSCKEILGVDQDNFYGKYDYWTKYIFPEDKEKIIECHKILMLQGFYEVEYRINKNGEVRWIEEKSYGIPDENGDFVKSSGICTDITEAKNKSEELKKLSLIAERTTNGVSITDKEGYVIWVNQGYLDMFEIDRENLMGKIPRELFIVDNEELLEEIRSKNGSNYKIELEITTYIGNKKWIEVNNTLITDENGDFLQQIDVITDITDRVKTKQKLETQSLILEEYTKDLEYQNKLKEKLIHADHIKEVIQNTLLFIEEQYENVVCSSILFPDSNFTRYSGYSLYQGDFIDEAYFTNELQCIEKALLGEIYIKENLLSSVQRTSSDIQYIERGAVSYLALPIQSQNEFLGIIIAGFSDKLNLNFKQITYLKETATVVGVTLNQIRLKDILQNKNEDILSSIVYAKNIQTSMFTNIKSFSKNFKNVCLFYRPKDIVSGDFYWGKDTERYSYLALGDCTGHGVPGAFITLLGINFLDQLIGIEKRNSPSEILTLMDLRLSSILKNHTSSEDSLYEGMELGLCVYDKLEKQLHFSGAGLGVLYFHNNEEIHIRGIRGGIGEPKNEGFSYQTTSIPLTGYEYFYMATDGYQDQLGGERSKRFSKNRLIALLNEIKFKDAEVQENILTETIDNYIGNYWQLDDFTVIGFTISI